MNKKYMEVSFYQDEYKMNNTAIIVVDPETRNSNTIGYISDVSFKHMYEHSISLGFHVMHSLKLDAIYEALNGLSCPSDADAKVTITKSFKNIPQDSLVRDLDTEVA